MDAINLADAKAHLSELVDRVEAGDTDRHHSGAASQSRGFTEPWPVPRKRVDATLLRALTATMPPQATPPRAWKAPPIWA